MITLAGRAGDAVCNGRAVQPPHRAQVGALRPRAAPAAHRAALLRHPGPLHLRRTPSRRRDPGRLGRPRPKRHAGPGRPAGVHGGLRGGGAGGGARRGLAAGGDARPAGGVGGVGGAGAAVDGAWAAAA